MAKVYRTYWRMRRRYHVAGYVIAALGTVLWAMDLAPILHGAPQGGSPDTTTGLLPSLGLLLAAAVLPIVLSRLLWNTCRWRYLE